MTTREELKELARKIGAALNEGPCDFYDVADAIAEGFAESAGRENGTGHWHRLRIEALNELSSTASNLIPESVSEARAAGASWVTIGNALDVSKQAAQQRYGKVDK